MGRIKSFGNVTAALAAVALMMILISTARVTGEDVKDVWVMNPPTESVPTQALGTTNIAGTIGINQKHNTIVLAQQSTAGIDPLNNTVTLGPNSTVCVDPACPVVVRQAATAVVFSVTDFELAASERHFGPIDVSAYEKVRVVVRYSGRAWGLLLGPVGVLDSFLVDDTSYSNVVELPGNSIGLVLYREDPIPGSLNILIYGR